MKIFFSYPHDMNAPLIERIKSDFEARGHEVWFDADQIKFGDDWRNSITRGIRDSQQVVAFLSKHAVRDLGVCLNEIAIALADNREAMVLVAPLLIECHKGRHTSDSQKCLNNQNSQRLRSNGLNPWTS